MSAHHWEKFKSIDYKRHLLLGFSLRVVFVAYGVYHDAVSSVSYTDVDYKVFTDASRYILSNESPYKRHTYRYSPLIAVLLVPNLLLHHSFGKLLFCAVDLIVALLIRIIVKHNVNILENYKKINKVEDLKLTESNVQEKQWNKRHNVRLRKKGKPINNKPYEICEADKIANVAMFAWLYNPMTVAIATRGNCDAIAGCLVLSTLYVLQCKGSKFLAGLIHGLAVHVRLYPLAYSLALFMYLSKYSFYSTYRGRSPRDVKSIENTKNLARNGPERKTIFKKIYLMHLVPNRDQLKLISGSVLSFGVLTLLFYCMYGYKFLHESYIYHLVRKDTRHNFSLYFYLQYLTAAVRNIGVWQKILMVLPQAILLSVFSVRYGLNKFTLNFSVLTQTIVMVAFNGVLTSQYFVWIMAVLPLSLWQIAMSKKTALTLIVVWIGAQGAWLLPAYFLEYQGRNTFLFIWIQGVSFFCANVAILGRLIMNFMPVEGYIKD